MGKNKKKKKQVSNDQPTYNPTKERKKNLPWICWCETTDSTRFGLYNVNSHCEKCSPSNTNKPVKLTRKLLKRKKKAASDVSHQQVVNLEENDESKLMSLLQETKGSSTSTSCTEDNQLKLITDICRDTKSSEVLTDDKIHRDNSLDHQLYCELKNKEENAYGLYQQMLNFRRDLPAYKMKKDILNLIDRNQVAIISGETGCGKTTQVAQFILDEYVKQKRGSTCHIICTQPRRISVVSVAERVAHERDEKLGKSCGYQIPLEAAPPRKQGSVLFCTLGVLLRFMIDDPYVTKASHIIIDEVQERDALTDFLLIIIKTILQRRVDLKIILMSATLNAETFSKYFEDCPTLNIPGCTYPVEEFFLEDIFGFIDFQVQVEKSGKLQKFQLKKKSIIAAKKRVLKKDGVEDFASYLSSIEGLYSSKIIQSLNDMDYSTIPYDLIIKVVSYICETSQDGAILIFLSGWEEIEKMMKRFSDEITFKNRKQFIILPIHSKLTSVSEKEIFEKPPTGCRKIIVGTNIVETSVTIDDVVYVIDTGKARKENTYDPLLNISSLQSSWVSKASLTQRLGRAGRVQPGKCYRLFTKHHEDTFEEYQVSEMLRIPLEQLCLSTKILKCGQVWPFLSKAVEPPTQKACEIAIQELVKMQALDADENLTSLGYYLALLPVAPKIGRMMITGAIFSCLDPVLTIAVSLESKGPSSIVQDGTGTYSIKNRQNKETRILAQQSKSDQFVLIKEFEGWERLQGDVEAQASYCHEHVLENKVLQKIVGLKKQFTSVLQGIGFIHTSDPKDQSFNRNSQNMNLIKAVLCAGLYPNVAKVVPELDKQQRCRDHDMRITPAFYTSEQRKLNNGNIPHLSVHPSSCVPNFLDNECHWLIYHELLKIENRRHRLSDITVVSPFPLLFFGGLVKYNGVDTIEVDGDIKIPASPKTAQIILDLRKQLDRLLNEKINRPSMQLIADGTNLSDNEKILQAIIDLISTEKVQTKMEFNAAATSTDHIDHNEDEDDDSNGDEDDEVNYGCSNEVQTFNKYGGASGVVTEEKEGFNSSNSYTSSGTQSSFSAQRATQSSFSAQRPPTQSSFSAQRPPTQSNFYSQRPPTQSSFSAQRPLSQSNFSAQRPPTQSNFYSQRPPTQSSFSTHRPPTQSSFQKSIPTAEDGQQGRGRGAKGGMPAHGGSHQGYGGDYGGGYGGWGDAYGAGYGYGAYDGGYGGGYGAPPRGGGARGQGGNRFQPY